MPKAVIFDWGGVLMRTEDYTPRREWDRRLGLEPGSVEQVVHGIPAWIEAQLGTGDLDSYWSLVAESLHLTPDLLQELRDDFYRGDKLDMKLVELIRDLKARGIQVGLLSNNTLALLGDLDAANLLGLFDCCLISAQIGVMKPEPLAYHHILDRLGVAPQDAILIDDSIANVEGARAVGMVAIHFNPSLDLRALLDDWLNKKG